MAERPGPGPGPGPGNGLRLGWYISKAKAAKLDWAAFVAHARAQGLDVVELDLEKPLEEQPECQIYIDKLTDEITAASSKSSTNTHGEQLAMGPEALERRLQEWQSYLQRRSGQIADLDPLGSQRCTIDRVAFLAILEELNHALSPALRVRCPRHALLEHEEPDYSARLAALRFPLLAKTVRACGAADAHRMSVVSAEAGLHALRPPLVVQEYLNHGAVIFKAFVVGDYIHCVPRPSLADLPPDPARPNLDFNSQHGVPPELASPASASASSLSQVAPPPAQVLHEIARWLSARMGLSLFGFDVVAHRLPGEGEGEGSAEPWYGVVDINYFPGYSGVPNFHQRLLAHALKTYRDKAASRGGALQGGERAEQESDGEQDEEDEAAGGGAAKRRKGEPEQEAEEPAESGGAGAGPAPGSRKKKRVALYLSYNGAGYLGMQKNPAVRTIEGELERALFAAGRIHAANYGNLSKIGWQRCARTDKGVSAVGQLVSAKLLVGDDRDLQALPGEVNAHLPPAIRVHACQRVTNTFNAKNNCNARTYHYLLPVIALLPAPHARGSADTVEQAAARFGEVMRAYEGTHSFHNFTAKVDAGEGGAQRYIMAVRVSGPRLVGGALECVVVEIVGQSFMLHQIRKMIGTAACIVRDGLAARHQLLLTGMFGAARQQLPMAPALGLLLVKCHFDSYNARMRRERSHPPLEFGAEVQAEADAFREQHVYAHMAATEQRELIMARWLRAMDAFRIDYARVEEAAKAGPAPQPRGGGKKRR